jgi:pantetheine-phosphate adenylyltransferase
LKRVIAIYPGTFDPPTNGHLDLIERGANIFDQLVVAILRNPEKAPLFTVEERLEMLRECTRQWDNVRIESFSGLLVDFARDCGARAVLRGIRAVSDYEYELQMAWMNRKLDPTLETIFMMPAGAYSYLSSRIVREIASLGGSLAGLVPASVDVQLRARLGVAPPLAPK